MIRQTSLKYRNQNKPTAFEEEISNLFLKDPSIQESWIYTDHKDIFQKNPYSKTMSCMSWKKG